MRLLHGIIAQAAERSHNRRVQIMALQTCMDVYITTAGDISMSSAIPDIEEDVSSAPAACSNTQANQQATSPLWVSAVSVTCEQIVGSSALK